MMGGVFKHMCTVGGSVYGMGPSLHKQKGVTLLELIVVMLILSTGIGLGVSSIKRKENQIKKTLRQFVSLNRQLHLMSRLKRRPYRLVFKMEKTSTTWWVESLRPPPPSLEEDKESETDKTTKKIPQFARDGDFFKKDQKLPRGLLVESMEFNRVENPVVSSGTSYVSYFPGGQTEQVLLQLKGKKNHFSIFIDRFLGEASLFRGEKTIKDLRQ